MEKKDVIEGFGRVLKEMAQIQQDKIREYGIGRYTDLESPRQALLMAYSDVYRKYIRLQQQVMNNIINGRDLSLPEIRESLLDLANYGGMGVQLVDMLLKTPAEEYMETILEEARKPNVDPLPERFAMEQIAIMATPGFTDALAILGADQWHYDTVVTKARVFDGPVIKQVAYLAFNYQLIPGKELEIIQYDDASMNWLAANKITSGLSHMGLHVNDIDEETDRLEQVFGSHFKVAQDAITISHTNPAIKDTRRYRYRVFDTRGLLGLGFDLKLIQRLIIPEEILSRPNETSSSYLWSNDPRNSWMTVEL